MKPERLTRAHKKEQTRERLIDAARTIFLQKGFAATSVEDVVEAAGYTRGAFYSNFRGKEELLTEVLRRDADKARAKLQAVLEEGRTAAETKACANACYSREYLESDCFPLWVEAQLLAHRDSAFEERVHEFQREKLLQVSDYIRAVAADGGGALPVQADALAFGLVSLCDGMRFFSMCNEQPVTGHAIQSVLAEFLSWILWRRQATTRVERNPVSAAASCI
jgi:AcrR family transcriptional regulator